MENRDFRDRLRNHTSEANPAAWEQMQGLLDSVQVTKTKDKDKKRGLWFFLFGIGVIAMLVIGRLWIDGSGRSVKPEKLSTNQTIRESLSNEKGNVESDTKAIGDANDESLSKDRNQKAETEYIEKGTDEYDSNAKQQINIDQDFSTLIQQDDGLKSKFNAGTKSNQKSKSKRNNSSKNFGDGNSTEVARTIGGIDFSLSDSTDLSKLNNRKSIKGSNANDLIENASKNEQDADQLVDDNSLNLAKSDSANESGEKEVELFATDKSNESRSVLLSIDKLILPFSNITRTKDDRQPSTPEIKIIKPSRFSILSGVGHAWFNDNPGFIINGGVYYDVDRILDLEANIGYVYGSEQGIPQGEKFTFEKEFDLSLLIHLNLIKSKLHKFSFIVGIGYSFYSGERVNNRAEPITVDVRSSRGRNFQGAINYQLRINNIISLGIRAGLISYDDAVVYITPQFIYDF